MPHKSRHSQRKKAYKSIQKATPAVPVTASKQEGVAQQYNTVISTGTTATSSKATQTIINKYPFISAELKYIGILAVAIFVIIIVLSFIL